MSIKSAVKTDFGVFIGESSFASDIRKIVDTVKNNRASILVSGERGSGKKTFAQFLHAASGQDESTFYAFNSSDFYADSLTKNVKEIINCSVDGKLRTVYIAQTEKLPLDLQVELLSFIKEVRQKQYEIRFVFGTETLLENAVEDKNFSKELFYAVSSVCVNMIPLRNRKSDIPILADYFLKNMALEFGSDVKSFGEACLSDMTEFFWQGNVSELKNSIERALIVCKGETVKTGELGIVSSSSAENVIQGVFDGEDGDKTLKHAVDCFKREYIAKVLEENSWNQTKSAKVLGIQRTYVIKLINELDIRKK